MNPRLTDWIWHVRGSVPLAPEQSSEAAFDKLMPLFRQRDTTHERTADTLIFRKRNQAPQDKMSIFDGGVLRIEKGATGSVLRYNLVSRALLFCFLAPLLFLGFAQLTVAIGEFQKTSADAAAKSEKAKDAKEEEKAKLPQNPIDKALGAPAPEKPKKKGADGSDKKDNGPSPTPAYVFAAIFAALYAVGRILEDRLIRRLFRKSLQPHGFAEAVSPSNPSSSGAPAGRQVPTYTG